MEIQYKLIVIWAVFLTTQLPFYAGLGAQQPYVVKKERLYWQEVKLDSLNEMVELKAKVPDIIYDLRYATKNNFTHKKLYKTANRTFLRFSPAIALNQIQNEMEKKGYLLKVFDGYRPYHVSVQMWKIVHDPRYVADPSQGSGHNRGVAVDITLVAKNTGKELDMGTGFDNFTDSAHQGFKMLPPAIIRNRLLLRSAMEEHGFSALDTEWWHYSWHDDKNYSILDLSFRQLAQPPGK